MLTARTPLPPPPSSLEPGGLPWALLFAPWWLASREPAPFPDAAECVSAGRQAMPVRHISARLADRADRFGPPAAPAPLPDASRSEPADATRGMPLLPRELLRKKPPLPLEFARAARDASAASCAARVSGRGSSAGGGWKIGPSSEVMSHSMNAGMTRTYGSMWETVSVSISDAGSSRSRMAELHQS